MHTLKTKQRGQIEYTACPILYISPEQSAFLSTHQVLISVSLFQSLDSFSYRQTSELLNICSSMLGPFNEPKAADITEYVFVPDDVTT